MIEAHLADIMSAIHTGTADPEVDP